MQKSTNLSWNLVFNERVQKLLDDFATVIGVHSVYYGKNGEMLKRGREEGCSAYCEMMQNCFFSRNDCVKMDESMQQCCVRSGRCEVYTCHAGLREAVMPVTAPGGERLGFLMFGQFRNQPEPPEELRKRAAGQHRERELQEAFHALPYYTAETEQKLAGVLALLVDYIVRCELVTSGENPLYGRIMDCIARHFAEPFNIDNAARELGRSVSGISHYLQKNGHASFLALLTEHRLRYAEHLLRTAPDLTIAEIARRSGFPDPYYFSRLYRKHRGISPGEFRSASRR